MALSKPITKAQDIMSCGVCESETKLKWKCLDCDLLMCNKCREKIHPKFKNADDHTILDIKEVGRSLGNIHLNFTTSNVKYTQPNHAAFSAIAEKGLADDERKLNQLRISESCKGRRVLQDIQAQKEELVEHADEFLKKVHQQMKFNEDSISEEQKKTMDSRVKMRKEFQKIGELIESTDPTKVFENIDKVKISLDTAIQPIDLSNICTPQFMPRKLTPSIFGSLTDVSCGDKHDIIEMKVKKQFVTGLKSCHFLSISSDGSCWLGDGTTKVLQRMNIDGDNPTTVSTIKTTIRGISLTPDGDILLANATPRLKLIRRTSGKVKESKYSVDPLSIISVHVTKGKVIVGAKSPGEVIPVTGRRVVIVMDKDGIHETVYEYDKNKQRLLTFPNSIASTSDGCIFIADFTQADKCNSRILALRKDGSILNTYSGHPDLNNKNEPFEPVIIASTLLDNIIIPDVNCHAFHILDNSCNLISYYKKTRE
ncbi:unnamed protein product [Mytilus coruscus]|uniref:B box-type domain-containing protein n=1 Tax=Mytilus coruscus TaxID=42192 RepID=A0A6J8APG3_MYTCO|nr:unnamed protein product [Mytilus coruscus]